MPPEIIVTRPLKLRLKRKSKSSFQSEYVEDVKELIRRNRYDPTSGELLFWIDRKFFFLPKTVNLDISATADVLDIQTMASSGPETLPAKNEWEMTLTLPCISSVNSLLHYFENNENPLEGNNQSHMFAWFEPNRNWVMRGKGRVSNMVHKSAPPELDITIKGTGNLAEEFL